MNKSKNNYALVNRNFIHVLFATYVASYLVRAFFETFLVWLQPDAVCANHRRLKLTLRNRSFEIIEDKYLVLYFWLK